MSIFRKKHPRRMVKKPTPRRMINTIKPIEPEEFSTMNELKKHSQKLNLVLGISGALMAALPLMKDDLGSYYGLVMLITAIVSAACVATKQNLSAN